MVRTGVPKEQDEGRAVSLAVRKPLLYLIPSSPSSKDVYSRLQLVDSCETVNGSVTKLLNRLPVDVEINIIIFDFNVVDAGNFETVLRLTRHYRDIPILVLANEIPIYIYQRVARLKSAITLQKKCSQETLESTLSKVAAGGEVSPSRFPRFETSQDVRMIVLNSGLLIPTRMTNYSAGGAFLEYKGISLKAGDQLQIGIPIYNEAILRTTDQMRARVVWIADGTRNPSKARGVGVCFIG